MNRYENKYLFKSRRAYSDLLHEMEVEYPEYFESKYAFAPETGESLQKTLKDNELLIEYMQANGAIHIFTVSKDQPLQVKRIPFHTLTVDRIESLHQMLQNSSMRRKSSREKFIALNYALYQQFLQPIEAQLAGKARLIIISDRWTNYVPFETLLSSGEMKNFDELDYLIKKHEVSYHYSASLFAKARRKEATTNTGIFAFAPVYDNNTISENGAGSKNATSLPENTLRAYQEDGDFSPLPESEREVKSIMKLFAQNSAEGNSLALRKEASETALKANLERPFRFVHIAGHSFADIDQPKFSGIACYTESEQDSTDLVEDGTLYTGEIYNISIQADLVTLSSCESGFGKMEASEGLLGLNRAFIYAGTPNVIFSLWKVYDKVSAQLMVNFYQGVLSGQSYATSLRQAKLKLLENEATAARISGVPIY